MTSYPNEQTFLPPELPPYIKKVHDLKLIVGIPSEEEIIGIHAVIRVANQVVDVQDVGDPELLARLSEHLFDVQMAKYRGKYSGILPEDAILVPPELPAHLSVSLTPVTGAPSEEEVVQVQSAIRAYGQCSDSSSLFDPRLDMELSQHLFNIQMARYAQRARQGRIIPIPHAPSPDPTAVKQVVDIVEEPIVDTNNIGSGSDAIDSNQLARDLVDIGICDTLERSNQLAEHANQLAERANQLIERSNEIAERSNRLMERSSEPADRSNGLFKKFNQLLERLSKHLEVSNQLAEESTNPMERVGDILENTNRVLAKVQHAIVRNHKGNGKNALDCLINERGEVPGASDTVGWWDLKSLSEDRKNLNGAMSRITIPIDGVDHKIHFPDRLLGDFLRFYGIGDDLCKGATSTKLKSGMADTARERLRTYWASCLG